MSTLTRKIYSLYAAYSPELGVVSYGACQDEALNNLADQLAEATDKPAVASLTPTE